MGVRKKKKPVKSVKRRVRIRPLPGTPTETELFNIPTENRYL